jgi:hypothetical protein
MDVWITFVNMVSGALPWLVAPQLFQATPAVIESSRAITHNPKMANWLLRHFRAREFNFIFC